MHNLIKFVPLFAAVSVGVLASRALAQSDDPPNIAEEKLQKSHLIDESLAPAAKFREQIESLVKKRQTKHYEEILDLLKKQKLDPAEALKNRDFLKGLHDNPSTPEALKKALAHLMDPEKVPLSGDVIDELKKFGQDANNKSPGTAEEKGGDSIQPGTPPVQTPTEQSRMGRGDGDGAGSGENAPPKSLSYAERFVKWLSGSPAMRRALRELGRHAGEEDPRWGRLSAGVESMKERWENLSKEWDLDRLFSKDAGWLAHLLPESLPDLRATNAQPSLPAVAETGGAGNLAVAAVALVLLGGMIFALLAFRARQAATHRKQREWHLGPWPVDPATVLTRGQLIQAFEYLSLLNLGPDARNWNHRFIAMRLGDQKSLRKQDSVVKERSHRLLRTKALPINDPLHREVAGELAFLYEQARYAPPGELLTDSGLAAARRDLCLLAGVKAA
jgi:hypothetical protein